MPISIFIATVALFLADLVSFIWLNKCQKIEAAGILCGDRPWKFCDSKAVSLTYISLGMESRRIFCSHEPTIQIDQIFRKDFWESLDNVFIKQRNITFHRCTFLTRNQLKGEPVEKFCAYLRELPLNCDLGSHGESIIRDVFIAKMQDGEIQRELSEACVEFIGRFSFELFSS